MDTWQNLHVSRILWYPWSISAEPSGRCCAMLDREVMTLGCGKQGFTGWCTDIYINIHHTHKHLHQAFRRLVLHWEKTDGGGHDRYLQGQLWTSPLLTASHLLQIMSTTAHTGSWVNPSRLPHALRINKHNLTPA